MSEPNKPDNHHHTTHVQTTNNPIAKAIKLLHLLDDSQLIERLENLIIH